MCQQTQLTKQGQEMIQIQPVEGKGLAVVATKRLDPGLFGLQVFQEEALVVFPPMDTSKNDLSVAVPGFLDPCPQLFYDWHTYLQKPKSVRAKTLKLYHDMNCPHAKALREYLHHHRRLAEQNENTNEPLSSSEQHILDNIEEFIQFAMVIRFNSVELQPAAEDGKGPGESCGHGLFETACRMNHSCKPNCVWFTTQDGKSKEIRAISTIAQGEELTIDYSGNLLDATPARRDEILQTKGFLCTCDRCAASHDDTRPFPCMQPNCKGVHFLHQPTYESRACLLPCTSCGVSANQEYLKAVMKDEINLVHEINDINAIADEDGLEVVKDRICRLDPPHKHHALAEKCYQLKGEVHSVLGDYRLSAEAYAKAIDCRISILGRETMSQATAFTCEKLGDALRMVNIEEAEEAYRRTVRTLELMRGSAHKDPYSRCAMEKLLDVQTRRSQTDKNLPEEKCLKGIADSPNGPPITDFPCQLCGKPSVVSKYLPDTKHTYCCEFHEQMHSHAVVAKEQSRVC